jgi:hypothetical protein
MQLFSARVVGTDNYLNSTGFGLSSLSAAAKLNSENAIRKKLTKYMGNLTINNQIEHFEIVVFNLEEATYTLNVN